MALGLFRFDANSDQQLWRCADARGFSAQNLYDGAPWFFHTTTATTFAANRDDIRT
jgi:hypothetical protein